MLCIGLHAPAISTTSHHPPSPTTHRQRQPPRSACRGLQVAEAIRLEHRMGLLRVTPTEQQQIHSSPSHNKIRHKIRPRRLEHRQHRLHRLDNRPLANPSLLHRHQTRSARLPTLPPPQLLPQEEDLHFQPQRQRQRFRAQTTSRMVHRYSRLSHNRHSLRRSARIRLFHKRITFNNRSRQEEETNWEITSNNQEDQEVQEVQEDQEDPETSKENNGNKSHHHYRHRLKTTQSLSAVMSTTHRYSLPNNRTLQL